MPSVFALPPAVVNDTGAISLGFQSAPNVFYDRTMVGDTSYTISTAGTTGGETLSITLRGAFAYSFSSAVAINWPAQTAPTPGCSASAFDRIKFEVLQDGSLLGTPEAIGAYAPGGSSAPGASVALTPLTATHGETWTGALSGLTAGDTLYVEASDDTALALASTSSTTASVSGTFAYAGSPVIAVQQTPAGGGSTTTTTFTMTVS